MGPWQLTKDGGTFGEILDKCCSNVTNIHQLNIESQTNIHINSDILVSQMQVTLRFIIWEQSRYLNFKGALYGFQLADTWWTIVALLHVGGHPFSAVLRGLVIPTSSHVRRPSQNKHECYTKNTVKSPLKTNPEL